MKKCRALVEWSPPTPEICGSNPVIGNFIYYQLYKINCIDENKEKRGRKWPNFFKLHAFEKNKKETKRCRSWPIKIKVDKVPFHLKQISCHYSLILSHKVSSSKMNCPFESLFLEPSQEGVFFLELLVQQIWENNEKRDQKILCKLRTNLHNRFIGTDTWFTTVPPIKHFLLSFSLYLKLNTHFLKLIGPQRWSSGLHTCPLPHQCRFKSG